MAITFNLGEGIRATCDVRREADLPRVTCEVQRKDSHAPRSFECDLESDGTIRIAGDPPRRAWAIAAADKRWVFIDGEVYELLVEVAGRRRRTHHHGSLAAPMPATVLRLLARVGDPVKRGDTLVILEAMKMELPVRSTTDGVITSVNCHEGDLVQAGVPLIEIDEREA